MSIQELADIFNISPKEAKECISSVREAYPEYTETALIVLILKEFIRDQPAIRFFSGKAKDIHKSYQIFSNFALVPVTIDGLIYGTSEHYFQAMKFINDDPEYAEEIRLASTPLQAKKLGKSRNHPIRADWNDVRIDVMREVLMAKAEQSEGFRNKLLESKGSLLIEASPFDSFWGEGKNKKGKNMLGKLLMEVRDKLERL